MLLRVHAPQVEAAFGECVGVVCLIDEGFGVDVAVLDTRTRQKVVFPSSGAWNRRGKCDPVWWGSPLLRRGRLDAT